MTHQEMLFPLPTKPLPENLPKSSGIPRVKKACRTQYEIRNSTLDELVDENHVVRNIWAYVDSLDLSIAYNSIQAVEGNAGRPAIDPKILVALWLYATIEGIGSAYVLTRYCKEHNAFRWICGGIEIERRTISDFRVDQGELFESLLAQSIAVLLRNNLVSLREIAQDGVRVRVE
jgi:transposase